MPRTQPAMHPISVQQMFSKQMNVCEDKQPGRGSRRLLVLPGISQGTHSEWEEKSKGTKTLVENQSPGEGTRENVLR